MMKFMEELCDVSHGIDLISVCRAAKFVHLINYSVKWRVTNAPSCLESGSEVVWPDKRIIKTCAE